MARLIEGIKVLYSGKDWLNRQICLFSVCGILGIINAYLALGMQSINEITTIQKLLFAGLNLIFCLFFVGYETTFLRTRELPDISLEALKIGLKRTPFIVFLISIPITMLSLFSKQHYFVFCADTILAIPMVMLLAGFSYNYDNNEICKFFKIFRAKEYFTLLIERIWVVIMCYIITLSIIFTKIVVLCLIIAFTYKGDVSTIDLLLSSKMIIIAKLASYIIIVLLTYILSIGTLAWDYELITTGEEKEKNLI